MSLIPKLRNSQSNLNSIYINLFHKVKTFTTAAETTDYQSSNDLYGSEGGGDFQQTTGGGGGGGGGFHNHTPNAHRGNPNDNVQSNDLYGSEGGGGDFQLTTGGGGGGGGGFHNHTPNAYRGNGFYQSEFQKTPNSSNFRNSFNNPQHNHSGYHPQEQNMNPGNNLRGFEQNFNGHYRGNSAPRGPRNESSYAEHLQIPNGYHWPDSNVNYGQFRQNSNAYNGLHSEMSNVHSQSPVNSVESESEVKRNVTLEELDGFCNEGNVKEAMGVMNLLYQQGIEIGLPRYYQLMKVIGEVVAKEATKLIHNHLIKTRLFLEIDVQNKALEMYLKCGLMCDARDLFGKIPARNLASWDTMIVGLAENGYGEEAIDVFTEFKEAGGRPDGHMFLGVFYACSTLCDVNEGMLHFESMSKVFRIAPSMDHYVGVVKMLGNTGYLDEAFEFIENMQVEPSIDVWETLMNLCRIHGNLETGDLCSNIVALLDPSRLNAESKAGLVPVNPSDNVIAEKEKKYLGLKPLGLQNRVQQYRAGDTSHADSGKIYAHLNALGEHMKEFGYIPELRCALHDVDDESKATALLAHSEKLACVSGLLSSPARNQIRIIKNLRSCVDCHNAFKLISKIVGRRIIARDAKRFHHFEEGVCSCNEYW